MYHKRPDDFGILAVCAFAFALLMAAILVDNPFPSERFASRMFAGVAGALALLTAEALWFVRPWAFKAALAFAGMLVVLVLALLGTSPDGLGPAAFALAFIGIALRAVHRGLQSSPMAGRVPVSAPHP